MNARSMSQAEFRRWPEIALMGGISLLVIVAALILSGAPTLETKDTGVASYDVPRYGTLAGVAGVRAVDRTINAASSAGVRDASLNGVAAVRDLDAGMVGEQPAASHLPGIADVRAVDRAAGLAESRLNLNGVAAVRALDAAELGERPAASHLPGVADVRAVDRAAGLAESRLNLSGVAAVRELDRAAASSGWTDPHLWWHGLRDTGERSLPGPNLNGVAAVRALDQ